MNLDIEMETGTGKTYCYLRTMYELQKHYGWSKFIVIVPSVAIREGVMKTFAITADHFAELYGKKIRYSAYNSKQLHRIERFANEPGLHAMVITMQAFNAKSKDQRRIYEKLDSFASQRPIDVLRATQPVLILDEPQKLQGTHTNAAFSEFGARLALRYSATHKTEHNLIHRLNAVDAYNQRLVKKIAVRAIECRGTRGLDAYLYLEEVQTKQGQPPTARVEIEQKARTGIRRITRMLRMGDNLKTISQLEQYANMVVTSIDAVQATLSFTNGVVLQPGEAIGDVDEAALRRLQIRETIAAHFEKERLLHPLGIKVLSLFFVDEVAKYRAAPAAEDRRGEYARIFEEEYTARLEEHRQALDLDPGYKAYLADKDAANAHRGYFSVDRQGRLCDPKARKTGMETSNDADAFDLIMKNKERLLSFAEPVRFIFSHSALREGWDNPNVFVLCMLKHTANSISRRQEVGRGLRIAVDQQGERTGDLVAGHSRVNVLTVVAGESYADFVTHLQTELQESLGTAANVPMPEDEKRGLRNKRNPANLAKQEFLDLWQRINRKAMYFVDFDADALIENCIHAINKQAPDRLASAHYIVHTSTQKEQIDADMLQDGETFARPTTTVADHASPHVAHLRYDLLGEVAASAQLKRKTVAAILGGIQPAVFALFIHNPEEFLRVITLVINEKMSSVLVEKLRYDLRDDTYSLEMFASDDRLLPRERAAGPLHKHVYEYAVVDSNGEREFAHALDGYADVEVFAKLPAGFSIPTPLGGYCPDWAIAFRKDSVQHVYFVAETKGSNSILQLRGAEVRKTQCAERFFAALARVNIDDPATYRVVDSFAALLQIIRPNPADDK